MSERMKIAVFCTRGLEEFVMPIIDGLRKHHEVVLSHAESPEETVRTARWADVVWLEWGNEIAIEMTKARGVLDTRHTILRVHSYEIFMNHMPKIRWDVVDQLICPNQYTMDLAMKSSGMDLSNMHRINQEIIPSGVDLNEFKFAGREHGANIAFVARLNHKKGIQLMLQAAAYLRFAFWEKTCMALEDFKIHIAGEWQDLRLKTYYEHMIKAMNLEDCIQFDGWVDHSNMPIWLADKNYILCCSPFESQGLGLMEAMAMGIKPLVHNFPGASEMYPAECLWNTLGQLGGVIEKDYNSRGYRTHIEKNFSSNLVRRKVNRALPSPEQIQSAREGKACQPLTTNSETTSPPQAAPQDNPGGGLPGPNSALPRLAVCLMYGNEEANLPRCLESIKDFADVIVAMDTGSTDSSTTILESYGAQVHVPNDLNHLFTMTENGLKLMFGPARNRLLSYIPEDCDWLFMIDCDEEFIHSTGSPDELKAWLGSLSPEFNTAAINMRDMAKGQVVMDFNATKFFKRGKVKFENIVHNEPVVEGDHPAAMIDQATMNHYGYDLEPDQMEVKFERTMGLLNKRSENDPQDWKAFFYKAQCLGFYRPEDLDGIIENSKIYVNHKTEVEEFNLSAYFTLIQALMKKGEAADAWTYILEARELLPDDLDIAMAMLEWGVWTKNEQVINAGTGEFMRIYDLYDKDPTKKGGRFIYSHNTQAKVFVSFYQTTSHLRAGAASLDQFHELADQVPEQRREQLLKDMDKALAGTGVNLVQPSAP